MSFNDFSGWLWDSKRTVILKDRVPSLAGNAHDETTEDVAFLAPLEARTLMTGRGLPLSR